MVKIHLVDGTYELFRQFFGVPPRQSSTGEEIGAVVGVLQSLFTLVAPGDYVGVATDHVIESFRNDLFPGYKTGTGIDPTLWSQFPILEEALVAVGFTCWPMIEFEADDALASAASVAIRGGAEDVRIYTPDKDLAQCVGGIVVQVDRRQQRTFDTAAVQQKFGVLPKSIPDYLALVGDSADGIPGLPGWGSRSTATVLSDYEHLEHIPKDAALWTSRPRSSERLASTLAERFGDVMLYRELATLRRDAPVGEIEEWRWLPDREQFAKWAEPLGLSSLVSRVRWITP